MQETNASTRPPAALVRAGSFLFQWRNALFPLACGLLLLPGPSVSTSVAWVMAAGVLLALLGQATRAATIGLDYIVRGGRGGRVYAEGLVTGGAYRIVRNPMYVGNVLIIAGLAVASNSWTVVILVAPLALFVYAAIVAAEEDFLRTKFGAAFERYCRDVPRWLPALERMKRVGTRLRFHWRRVIVKEYGTPYGWICVMCLLAWHHVDVSPALHDSPEARLLVVVALAIASALWMIARLAKKARWLVPD